MRLEDLLQESQTRKSEKPNPFYKREINISFRKKFGDKKKYKFYNDLSILMKAGVDAPMGLELLNTENSDSSVVNIILRELISGRSFSESLRMVPNTSEYEVQSVRIGEETGKLRLVMEELAAYYKSMLDLRSQLLRLLSYPVMVLVIALGVTYFMLVEVVPLFENVFKSFGKDLPALTQKIVALSVWVQSYGFIVLVGIVLLAMLIFRFRKDQKFQRVYASILLSIPVIGKLVRKVQVARFAQFMNLLSSSGIPLSISLELSAGALTLLPYKEAILQSRIKVINGESLKLALSSYPKLFDKSLLAMVGAAEELNQLPEVYSRVSILYKEEVSQMTEIIGKLAEPILILFISFLIGIILIAMYLPLFKMGEVLT